MIFSTLKLTVYYEGAFWVGVFERSSEGQAEAVKILFGAEPSDGEIYEFILTRWNDLHFSQSVETSSSVRLKVNPKRLQRLVKKEARKQGVGTKAQQALKVQQEQEKLNKKVLSRKKKEQEEEMRFLLKKMKRKEKHKGH